MRPNEIRNLSDAEIAQKETEMREQVFRLRLRGATGQIENKMKARLARRDLARVLTIRSQRTSRTGVA
ncbi:MAG: 50S ribosomal protein L29 [Deltaproteobacteria bacterium]|nr:50S ribosomal protein L29 [Deltaproteobacteria bacterium]